MLAKAAAIFTLAILAVAAPGGSPPPPASQCNTGTIQCCNSVQDTDSNIVAFLAGLLDILLSDLTGQVGVVCSPVTVVGGDETCNAEPVCCTGSNFGGVLVGGCSPVTLNL